ncbi:sugar transferase [Pseudonocardia oroxyli]|uniref:Exopolysaccharide biosynthesis polyprenyl glycosylphosphotransferase n=1 Tax=Pseudonocardia oroxyli TaxID=366584 RepID=A0A1G7ZD50_PSEOR|nr:sugar transferase [Pseudonocardia oroxyli]SDH06555.1 exopolysaccharide biosynthesis polyprenyl glycosylphosphotransferase [Pseudonocardia oroxyli]
MEKNESHPASLLPVPAGVPLQPKVELLRSEAFQAGPIVQLFGGIPTLLLVADTVAVFVACVLAGLERPAVVAVLGIVLSTRYCFKVYRGRLRLSFLQELPRSVLSVAVALAVLTVVSFVWTRGLSELPAIALTGSLFLALTVPLENIAFQLARWARRRGRTERTVIVGASRVGLDLARLMGDHPEVGLRPLGFVDADASEAAESGLPVLGSDLATVIRDQRVSTVVIAFSADADTHVVDLAITARQLGVSLLVVPRFFELYRDAPDVERLRSYPLVRLTTSPTHSLSWSVKILVDKVVAGLALLFLAPVILIAALAVLVESGRPILFRQERVGLDGKLFTLFKLRSMRPADNTESATRWSIAGDPRVGPVGRVLRRTSLDELPQLWNVVRGDMSLVGPRPERPGFVQEFSAIHDRYWARHRVPTGLTGLAQVNGLRGNTSISDRARYDNYYIANWSLWLDVSIMLMTARELVRRGDH